MAETFYNLIQPKRMGEGVSISATKHDQCENPKPETPNSKLL
jgi:hypothetical protein